MRFLISTPSQGDGRTCRALPQRMPFILNALTALAGLVLLPASPILAQSLYWDANGTTAGTGAASTANWDIVTSNWNTDSTGVTAPGLWADGNIAVFSAGIDGTGIQNITVVGTLNPLGITVEEGTVNLSGGTLDLGGDTVSVGAGTSTISSVVSGSGILTKSGAGTLVLSGNNTFTGTMTTGVGVLRATANANALGTGAATLNLNGGTLWLANDTGLSFNRNTTVSAATTVTLGRAAVAGNGGQTFVMGTLAMGSATLTVNADSATLNVANNSATTLTFGATTFSADATFNVVNSTATGGNTTVNLGAITNDGTARNLIKNGNGRLTLTAATNSYGGKTTVNGGLVSINADAGLGAAPSSGPVADQLTLNGGGLEVSATLTLSANRGITLGAAHGTLDVNSGLTLTVSGVITGSGNLTKADSGTLILGSANTYTGTTIVTGGTLRVDQNIASGGGAGQLGNSTAAIQVGSAGLVTSGGFTIERGIQVNASGGIATLGSSATSGTTVYSGNITNNNAGNSQQLALQAQGTSRVEFNGNISGNSSANSDGDSSVYTSSSGTGTVVLGGNNTYRGYTQVSANTTLVARSNNALGTGTGSFGTGVVTGATLELQNNITTPEEIIINGTGVASAGALKSSGGNNTVSGPVTLGSAATVNSATAGQTLTLAGNVKADYALTVTGAGNTTISGVISGQTGFVAGLREGRVTAGSAFNTSTANPGGAQVVSPIAGYNNDKTAATGKWADQETWVYTGQFYDADGKFAFAENIDDSVQIWIDDKVVLTNQTYNVVSTTNSTTANTAPSANITSDFGMGANGDGWHKIEIRFGNGGGGAGPVVGSGWTSNFGFGYNPFSGGTSTVSFDGTTFFKVEDNGSMNLLRTEVSNSLTKTGTGILTLSNANTYAGPTTVTQGTLLVTNVSGSGTGTGAVTVANGGSLGGTGRIAGSTVISVGGKLIMGSDTAAPVGTDFGTGTLSFDSDLAVSGTINFDLASSTVFDKLSVGGILSLDANTIININPLGFIPNGTEVFDIIDAASISMTGFDPNSLSDLILPSLASGYQWDTSRFGTEGVIAIIVPEPSRVMLYGLGLAALVLRRRRRVAA